MKKTTLSMAGIALPIIGSMWGCAGSSGSDPIVPVADTRSVLYAMSNAATNEVVAWHVNLDGTFEKIGTFATGGAGSPTETPGAAGPKDGIDPLGTQGSLTLSPDNRYLYAVNAGSNEISEFGVGTDGSLSLIEKIASGGVAPVSVTARNGLVYVANANGATAEDPSTITGFTVSLSGGLTPIAGLNHQLSDPIARPGQIEIAPDGHSVVVTEQGIKRVSSYHIKDDGTLGNPKFTAAAGAAPFGFAFINSTQFVVTDAMTSSLSSYNLASSGPTPITLGLADTGKAACWVSIAGSKAYVSDSATDSMTTFAFDGSGVLSIQQASIPSGGAGSVPIDNVNAKGMLFALLGGQGKIAVYTIGDAGNLNLQSVQPTELPTTGTAGLAIRG